MNLRFIDWIWRVRGIVPLEATQSPRDAFDKLDILFQTEGTSHAYAHDTLTFRKENARAQDRMAVFDSGQLRIVEGPAGPALAYDLNSRALLFCFLAPLLFLAIARLIAASRTPGYVFAVLFAVLYVGGRVLEQRLVRSLFRKTLLGFRL